LKLANINDDEDRADARRTVLGAPYSGTELVAQLRALGDAAAEQMGFDPRVRPLPTMLAYSG
jgi:NADH:ubiquinone reductase (H+-translocating)